jgi:hypothetical protein
VESGDIGKYRPISLGWGGGIKWKQRLKGKIQKKKDENEKINEFGK